MKKVLWSFSYDCPNFAKAAYKNKSFIERCMSEFDLPELSVDNLKDQKCFDAVKVTKKGDVCELVIFWTLLLILYVGDHGNTSKYGKKFSSCKFSDTTQWRVGENSEVLHLQ